MNLVFTESIVHFYYSMYALAKILLLEKDIITKSHEGTINMIQVHYVETGELDKDSIKVLQVQDL